MEIKKIYVQNYRLLKDFALELKSGWWMMKIIDYVIESIKVKE
ncbi:hypothetical protein [Streptococcus phocae]|nr:hypothetical protein [Streptococcus phocae]